MKRQSVYGLFDPATGEIRYVGRTVNLSKRVVAHRNAKDRIGEWVRGLSAPPVAVVLAEPSSFFDTTRPRAPWTSRNPIHLACLDLELDIIKQYQGEALLNRRGNMPWEFASRGIE